MREDQERLQDILEAIERIKKHASRGWDAFRDDELLQVWIVHHLRIIGEAARCLDDELRQRAPEIPWSKIIGMRNVLVHHYFGIDLDIVWGVVQDDLPALETQIRAVATQSDGSASR